MNKKDETCEKSTGLILIQALIKLIKLKLKMRMQHLLRSLYHGLS